jgi:putative molybdopterin biosynthesis protein
MTEPLALTVAETAETLRLGRNRVYDLVASGDLPHVRIGTTIRIPTQQLRAWIEAQTEGTQQHGNNR